ncbi:MAG: hypothetical protein AB7N76_21230 [Planctomycetota bacterium]
MRPDLRALSPDADDLPLVQRLLARAAGASLALVALPTTAVVFLLAVGRRREAWANAAWFLVVVAIALALAGVDLVAHALRREPLRRGTTLLALALGACLGVAALQGVGCEVAYLAVLSSGGDLFDASLAMTGFARAVVEFVARYPASSVYKVGLPLGLPFGLLCAARLRRLSPSGEAAVVLLGALLALPLLGVPPYDFLLSQTPTSSGIAGAELGPVGGLLLAAFLALTTIVGGRFELAMLLKLRARAAA